MRFIVLLLFAITSCNNKKPESINSTNLNESNIVESTELSETESNVEQIQPKIDNETKLYSLLEDGLEIADSSESCRSQRFEAEPRTKFVINFPGGNKLIIPEWEYGIKDNDIELMDFIVYNCKTNETLMESHYTIASYEIIDALPALKIKINAGLPDDKGVLKSQDFIIKEFYEEEGLLKTRTTKLFRVDKIPATRIDSIETEFQKRPILEPDSNYDVKDFANERVMLDLFKGAINGNQKCVELFESISDKYVLDGAISELYGELYSLLEEI